MGSSCLHSWTTNLIRESFASYSSTVVHDSDHHLVLTKLNANGIVRTGSAGTSVGKVIPEYHLTLLSATLLKLPMLQVLEGSSFLYQETS